MSKSYVSIINKQYAGRQAFYLKDPKSDIFAILNEKIYPLHKNFLTEAEYFSNSISSNQKVHMLDPSLDQKSFQMILSYFYGKQLQFFRNWDLVKLLCAVNFLNISSLYKKIINDVKANFDDYGFFLALVIGQKFNIKWLKQKCDEQLLLMGFQQLNFNRYDLLQVDKKILQQIIKMHELLRINQNIVGLKESQLKKIIKQYCKANKLSQQQSYNLCSLVVNSDSQSVKIQLSHELIHKSGSRQESTKLLNVSSNLKNPIFKSQQQTKRDQVSELKNINQKIQQSNSKMFQQIKHVKNSLQSSMKLQVKSVNTDSIDQKFRKFQRTCQQQDQKYLNLKKQMQKLNSLSSGKKSQQSEPDISENPIGSSTSSTKDNEQKSYRSRKLSEIVDSKKLNFPQMPRLTRDLD